MNLISNMIGLYIIFQEMITITRVLTAGFIASGTTLNGVDFEYILENKVQNKFWL